MKEYSSIFSVKSYKYEHSDANGIYDENTGHGIIFLDSLWKLVNGLFRLSWEQQKDISHQQVDWLEVEKIDDEYATEYDSEL
jgi:hypothetical protein